MGRAAAAPQGGGWRRRLAADCHALCSAIGFGSVQAWSQIVQCGAHLASITACLRPARAATPEGATAVSGAHSSDLRLCLPLMFFRPQKVARRGAWRGTLALDCMAALLAAAVQVEAIVAGSSVDGDQ